MIRHAFVLLAFLATFAIALPAVDLEELKTGGLRTETVEFTSPETNEIKTYKTIHEIKGLMELFSQLREARDSRSLSIVGRDKKYIYLMVTDTDEANFGKDASDVDALSDVNPIATSRVKRGLGKFGQSTIRNAAVTISLFNYLGYLPMRLPGVPYHIDTGSPDYNPYNYVNEFPYVKEHHF